jgi:transposase
MSALSSLAKTILLNHISRFHSSSLLPRNVTIGRTRKFSFPFILDRILFVLSSGCQWARLPITNGSWKTIYHYFSLWSKANLFQHAYDDLLRVYLKTRPRSTTRVVDTSFVKNVFGRQCVGSSPFDRGRNATKVSTVTDHAGVPLVFTFHKGNRNDSRTLFHYLSKCKFLSSGDKLYADKIYDTSHCKEVLSHFQLENCISKKKQITSRKENRVRIVVEHTFGWLDKYRRIILRYDAHVHSFRSFHYLASTHLVGNRLLRT